MLALTGPRSIVPTVVVVAFFLTARPISADGQPRGAPKPARAPAVCQPSLFSHSLEHDAGGLTALTSLSNPLDRPEPAILVPNGEKIIRFSLAVMRTSC